MQRTIIFTHTGSSALFGNFASGDRLTCGADAAAHFVDEARCAVYADGADAPAGNGQPPDDSRQAPATKRGRAKGDKA